MTATVYDFDREADLRSLLDSENLPRVSALAVIDVTRMRLQELRPYVRVGHFGGHRRSTSARARQCTQEREGRCPMTTRDHGA
jgi:hypothetical protein